MDATPLVRQMLAQRWGLTPEQTSAIDSQDETWAQALALSLNLGALFDENEEAERAWMAAPRDAFGGRSARDVLLDSDGLGAARQLLDREDT